MKHRILIAILLATTTVAACKKKDGGDKPAEGAAKPTETTPGGDKPADDKPADDKPAPSGPFAGWDMDARKAAFQGAFVAPGGSVGQWEAWNVEGNKVTIWDGTSERTAELSLTSPCEAWIMVKGADGSSSGTVAHFTVEDGKLMTGLGDAGARKGPTAVACISSSVFTLDDKGTCLEWEQDMFEKGKYRSKPGKCRFDKDGDKEVFKATVHDYETVLEVHGDALYTSQIANTHAEKVADFAAAKTGRDAKK